MAETTGISWCDSTWNPWRGCTKASEGCKHCYAETLSGRNPGTLGVWGPNGTRVYAAGSYWILPAKWNRKAAASGKPWRVFCASLADVFEDWQGGKDYPGEMVNVKGGRLSVNSAGQIWSYDTDGPPEDDWGARAYTMDDARARAFRVMESTPALTWLVLTKRPENILHMVPPAWLEKWPANVWPGTTTEDQPNADRRIPELLKVPAAVRWLSVEPQIGPVDLRGTDIDHKRGRVGTTVGNWLTRHVCGNCGRPITHWTGSAMNDCGYCGNLGITDTGRPLISWVITGGESGHGARPFDLAWARSLRDQCKVAGVAFFHKQMGANPIEWESCGIAPESIPGHVLDYHLATGGSEPDDTRVPLVLIDRKAGKDPSEWPADLRIQNFPAAG